MSSRWWLNASLLIAIAVLAAWVWLKPHSAQSNDAEFQLSTLKPAQVTHINIEIGTAPAIQLERATGAMDNQWRITQPVTARVDAVQVQQLLNILDASTDQRWPATGLSRYELDPPHAKLTINQQQFSFGAYNEMSRAQYVLTQNNVYLIAPRYGIALPGDVLKLVSKQLFADDEVLASFAADQFELSQRAGKWQLTPSGNVNTEDIERWLEAWRHAYAYAVIEPPHYAALQTIKVTLNNGKVIAVEILQRAPQLVIKRSDQTYALQFSDAAALMLTAPKHINE